ncbi:MAG: alpha/beta hydrolase [Rhodospirillales bacterium]|nr:alpha/beta hydrolase [Rhodospirillales bacterium]
MRFAATSGAVPIAYEVIGAGAPIVLLHDFGESRGFWRELGFVDACLAHERQVVLIDLRGHGASGKPANPLVYGLADFSRDVVAALDDAGIHRADLLGYGLGARVALAIAAYTPERVRAVAAGGAHPYAERMQLFRDVLSKGLEAWVKVMEAAAGGLSAATRDRLLANDAAALAAAVENDRPDMADALARSSVPVLLFLGGDDPRYLLALSFAEQSGATVIALAGHGYATAPVAARKEILPRILDFFEQSTPSPAPANGALGVGSGCRT